MAKLPLGQARPAPATRKRNRGQMDHPNGTAPEVDGRNARPRFNDPLQRYLPDNYHPMPPLDPQNVFHVPQDRERGSPSASPPADPLQPPRNADSNSDPTNARKGPPQGINPPRTDGDPSPTLTDVNPEQGPLIGGSRVWLKGRGFPNLFPLFARFGTAVVQTVSVDCLASLN
jgi:hypothetical protein